MELVIIGFIIGFSIGAILDYINKPQEPVFGAADEIEKLADLLSRGLLTQSEFDLQKQDIV